MSLKGNCRYCNSEKIKISSTYPSDYFCMNCGKGDLLSSLGNSYNRVWDKINKYFDNPDLTRFQFLNPKIVEFSKFFKIKQVYSHKELALCFALSRPSSLALLADYPQKATDCPNRFLKHLKETNGWLIWQEDLIAIINFHFGIYSSLVIMKKIMKKQDIDLSLKFSPDEIEWIKIYAPYTLPKSHALAYAENTVREFEKL